MNSGHQGRTLVVRQKNHYKALILTDITELSVSRSARCRCSRCFLLPLCGFNSHVISSVGKADIFDHAPNQILIVRQEPGLDLGTEQITQYAPEVFMPRI